MDESDNLLGGWLVSKGFQIYRDYYTQHPPLMYYICGLIYYLGARSVAVVRIYFFFFLSLIWTFMFLRYRKHFGSLTMALYPILYIFILGTILFGNTVLSDQVQANALVILFLEFLVFEKRRVLKYDNYIVISLAVFFSIGTAINSLIPILFICIGILLLELFWFINKIYKEHAKVAPYLGKIFLRYVILFAAVALPFIILTGIYYQQKILGNAYYQIFTFNTQVYSKYSNYGTSIFTTLQMPVYMFSAFIIQIVNALNSSFITNFPYLIDIVANFLFFWLMIKQKRVIVAAISFLTVIMSGTRGYSNFHAIPYFALSSIMIAYLIYQFAYLPIKQSLSHKDLRIFISATVVILISCTFFSNYHVNATDGLFNDGPPAQIQVFIDELTTKKDKIYIDTLDNYSYIVTDRLPASRVATLVPWFADVWQNQVIADLKANNTKLIVYTPYIDVWGLKASTFEMVVQKYISDNYTLLTGPATGYNIWIRNDYYSEACKKLNITT